MKLYVVYAAVEIDVDPADIADLLDLDTTDDQIKLAVAEHIDLHLTEMAWPSYSVDKDDLVAAVRESLAAAKLQEESAK